MQSASTDVSAISSFNLSKPSSFNSTPFKIEANQEFVHFILGDTFRHRLKQKQTKHRKLVLRQQALGGFRNSSTAGQRGSAHGKS